MDTGLPLTLVKASLAMFPSHKGIEIPVFQEKQNAILGLFLDSNAIGKSNHDEQAEVIIWRRLYESDHHGG
jgi:hypothetical protein